MAELDAARTQDTKHRGLLLATLLAFGAAGPAAALEVEPGLWEFQVTVQGGMMGNQVLTNQQCLQDADLDPTTFQTQMGPCSVDDTSTSADSLSWTFSCNLQGMETSGKGTMYASGDTVRGSVRMTMSMPATAGGQQFTLDNTWAGRRVGDCF